VPLIFYALDYPAAPFIFIFTYAAVLFFSRILLCIYFIFAYPVGAIFFRSPCFAFILFSLNYHAVP